jgi:Ca2+/H+ antiporter, TMEM165/GDT1 family
LLNWGLIGPPMLAAFLASIVEGVEALTVVLAVGATRGWKSAMTGAVLALAVLLALVAILGPALALIPLKLLQLGVGTLLLLFGMRWLRKAILRAAGVLALHDEAAIFQTHTAAMRAHAASSGGWDSIAIGAAFQITLLEGVEVVFIVIAVSAGGPGLLIPASLAAVAAVALVVLLGFVVHKPLAQVPENTLKFVVGILLSAFGSFWAGEGLGVAWPGDDWSILALVVGFAVVALLSVIGGRGLATRKVAR